MTADALMAAIRADPDADLPRLVYADHLDDAGDPARAEFIRVQCELARLDEADPRRPALEDREHELLDAHEAAWLGDLRQLDEWGWRRGFVDEATGDHIALSECGSAGFYGHPVQSVTATYCVPNRSGGPGWLNGEGEPWMASIRHLTLAGQGRHLGSFHALFKSPHLAGLTWLDVSANVGQDRLPDALAGASFVPNFRELTAGGSGCGPEPVDAEGLARVLAPSPLERLRLPDSGLTGDGLTALLTAPFAGRLSALDLSDNPLDSRDAPRFLRLPGNARLTRLDVSGTEMGGYGLGPLLAGRGLARLTDLDASDWVGPPAATADIAGSTFWRLAERLRLRGRQLHKDAVKHLTTARGPRHLRLLDLGDNALGAAAVAAVCRASWSGGLDWLALSRNLVDDEACRAVAGGLGRLRTLHLAHHAGTDLSPRAVTDAGATALASAPSLSLLRILTLSHTSITDRSVPVLLLDAPHWRLAGLGLAGCDLSDRAVHALATSPRLHRLQWLDLSGNPRLGGNTLMPLAESPHLSRLCELDIGGVDASDRVRDALRQRLGRRLSD